MNLREGTILQDGKYHIVRFIKGGGFGCTYEAEHTLLEKRVAVKEFFVKDFCNRDEATGHVCVGTQGNQALVAKLKRKFLEEAKVLSRLHHKGIVSVTDVFEENGTAYYVMDYIEGCSLHATLEHEGKLSEERALGYIRQVAEALAYVHAQHRLHLDVKPGNIMVDEKGNATLIDFGTSKQYDEENGENTSTVQGYTKGFAPPEQMTNDVVKFMPSTDIYALGATLYKLLTGITPPSATLRISGEGLAALPASVSAATEQAMEQAMQLNKALRPQTIDAFLALLGTPSTVADDEETDLDIDDNKDDDVNHRGDEHKGKSGLSLRMKKLLWPIVVCVAVALAFLLWSKRTMLEGDINGRNYVDLGLSVKWATCNIGASSPSDYGEYYAYGEIDTKESYIPETYKFYNAKTKKYTIIENDITGTSYDVAHVKWGGSWRLPTEVEFQELIDNCTWTWERWNGVNGYRVIGPNGKSIFLPAADSRASSTAFYSPGRHGYYRSGSLDDRGNSVNLYFYKDKGEIIGGYPICLDYFTDDLWYGYSIRPVSD